METQMYFWLIAVPLLNSALAVDKAEYVAIGGTLELRPPQASSDRITSILWKYEGNLVAEWVDGKVPLEYYGKFKGRTTLNTTNGYVEIKNMSKDDKGIYLVEINNKVQDDRYSVTAITKVPTPEVLVGPLTCGTSSASDSCILTCNGIEDTTDAEPITYSWKKGDQEWENKPKEISITNNKETQSVKTFTCRMENPVSGKASEARENPFFKEETQDSGAGLAVGLTLFFLASVAVGGVGWLKRADIKKYFCPPQENRNGNQQQTAATGENSNRTNDVEEPLNKVQTED